jgi:uncharacterized protein (TIGR00255 family)
MTGFGRAESRTPLGHFSVEIRAVNSRFLEARALLPPILSGLEHELRAFLQSRVRRGKLDCRVRFVPAADQARPARFNEAAIRDYLRQWDELSSRLGLPASSIGIAELLRLPGALDAPGEDVDLEPFWEALRPVVESALERFDDERAREGAATGLHLSRELQLLRDRRAALEAARPAVLDRFRERLLARIAELSADARDRLDPGRIELEVTLFTDRSDIAEELTRLDAHLSRLEELLTNASGSPVGKALDFLVQEILREVNTTASKLRDVDAVASVLEMKGAVERLREQIQNLE